MRSFLQLLRRLKADNDGVAAVELALILPIAITMLSGSFELSNLLVADLKVTTAAETASDLIAQTQPPPGGSTASFATTAAQIDDIVKAVQEIIVPNSTGTLTTLKVAVVSIQNVAGHNTVIWHAERNGATQLTLTTAGVSTILTNTIPNTNDSVVIVATLYNYTSPLGLVLAKNWSLSQTSVNRPRYVQVVTCSAGTTC